MISAQMGNQYSISLNGCLMNLAKLDLSHFPQESYGYAYFASTSPCKFSHGGDLTTGHDKHARTQLN